MKKKPEHSITTSANGNYDNNRDKEMQVFELQDQNNPCGQLVQQIMLMPPELQDKFDFSFAAQGAAVRIPASGMGEIEVTAPKYQILISPRKPKNDH